MSGMKWPVEHVLAGNLKRLREEQKLSEENAARYAGLTTRAYREIEDERHTPSIMVLVRLARALRCSLDDLIPLDEVE